MLGTFSLSALRIQGRLLHDRSERRIVRHYERLELSEFPVSALVVCFIRSGGVALRELRQAMVERNVDGKVGHAESEPVDLTDRLGQFGTNLQDVRILCAEDADRTVGLIASQSL